MSTAGSPETAPQSGPGANGSPAAAGIGSVAHPVATDEEVARAYEDTKLAQVLYHDWEAQTYDEKWSIGFDQRCIDYARDRFGAIIDGTVRPGEAAPWVRALELGAGTGFFSLNLKQAGLLEEVHVTDLSPGMVDAAKANAEKLGFTVEGRVADAERIPYDDNTFDIVVGHAVIHHIPDVEASLREVLRVLKPGGRFVIAGEPTRIGDWYARRLGRITWEVTTRATRLGPLRQKWFKGQEQLDETSRAAALEAVVDLHTFDPSELERMALRAGAIGVRTRTNELTAALLGWPIRTFEAAVREGSLGFGWARFAYGSWRTLSRLDGALARVVPAQVFYNVGITGLKPGD